jgi:hypothetical protein
MAARAGFLIKNEPDVGSNLDLAEPDALDFNLLGNQRYGVITGCEATVTGSSRDVTVAAGVYVVNGVPVRCTSRQTTLSQSSQDARFDLIVGDVAGFIFSIKGTESPNPVFPTYDDKVCVFAAVLILPGNANPQQGQLTDKRIMVMERFATAITNGGHLLSNQDPTTLASMFRSARTARRGGGTPPWSAPRRAPSASLTRSRCLTWRSPISTPRATSRRPAT